MTIDLTDEEIFILINVQIIMNSIDTPIVVEYAEKMKPITKRILGNETNALKRPEDFFTSPKESKMLEESRKRNTESESELFDEDQQREQENWNYLANKVVGAKDSQTPTIPSKD